MAIGRGGRTAPRCLVGPCPADALQGGLPWREVPTYIAAQVGGAFAGVAAAHLMFGEPVFFASRHIRAGNAQLFSEFIATFGLLAAIFGCSR